MRQASWYEWTTATLGAILIALLWAPWYFGQIGALHGEHGWTRYAHMNVKDGTLNGWEGGSITSVVVAVVGALCIAQLIALMSSYSPGGGLAWNVSIVWLAVLAVVWIAVRVIWPPDDAGRDWGSWTSLIVALGILLVSWKGMADERTTMATPEQLPVRPIPPAGG